MTLARRSAWAPAALTAPRVVAYKDGTTPALDMGLVSATPTGVVTTGTARADTYVFPDGDIILLGPGRAYVPALETFPGGGHVDTTTASAFTHYFANTQATPLRRSNGLQLKFGGNLISRGFEVDVSTDYVAAASLSPGYPDFYLSQKNRAILLICTCAANVTVHMEQTKISGSLLYEGINIRGGSNVGWQFIDTAIIDPVRYYPTGVAGPGNDHDGGDVFQTQTTTWRFLRIDGLYAKSAWFQGVFLKRESADTSGPIDVRNVFLEDYQGPGAAFYVNANADHTWSQVKLHNFWVDPGFQRAPSGTVGVTTQLSNRITVEQVSYPKAGQTDVGSYATSRTSDTLSAYATSTLYLDVLAGAGGRIREGVPAASVLAGTPGMTAQAVGYITDSTSAGFLVLGAPLRFRPLAGGADIFVGSSGGTYPPNYGTPGSYRPDANTTGPLSTTTLTPFSGNLTVTTANQTFDSIEFFGKVSVQAANATFNQCVFHGKAADPNGQTVNCAHIAVVNAQFNDCVFAPLPGMPAMNGINGHDFTLRRCEFSNFVDPIDPYAQTKDADSNVIVEQCWLHDFAYYSPDSGQANNQTHNDGLQIQGCHKVTVRGCSIEAYYGTFGTNQISNTANPTPAGWANPDLTCILLNTGATLGTTQLHTVTDNWLLGAFVPCNLGGAGAGVNLGTWKRNRFSGDSWLHSYAGVTDPLTIWMRSDQIIDAGEGTSDQNTFLDGITPIRIHRNG